jgi:hypothetical protein
LHQWSCNKGAASELAEKTQPSALCNKGTASQLAEKLNQGMLCNNGTASAGPKTSQNESGL